MRKLSDKELFMGAMKELKKAEEKIKQLEDKVASQEKEIAQYKVTISHFKVDSSVRMDEEDFKKSLAWRSMVSQLKNLNERTRKLEMENQRLMYKVTSQSKC